MKKKRILFLMTRETSGLHQAAYLLAFFTLLSQILGLFRDRLLAHGFGASSLLDIYYAAFRIPDLILATAASIVSISIIIPLLTEKLQEGHDAGKKFIDSIFSAFFVFIIITSALAFFLMPTVIPLFFPGFSAGETGSLIALSRLLLLSPILLGFSNLFASIVQVHKRFFVYAMSPILYNLGIIFGIVILYPLYGLLGLGAGVVLGALLHMGILVPSVAERKFLPTFRTNISKPDLKHVVLTSIPRAFTLSTTHITLLVLIGIASLIAEGAITIFNFAYNLQSVPLALIGVSYSLAAFPTLSRLFAEGKVEDFLRHIYTAVRHVIFWSIPAIVLFIVLRAHIVRVLLGTGEFGWDATRLTAAALALFVFSILGQALMLLFIRGYYAAGNTLKPLYINVVSAIAAIGSTVGLLSLYDSSPLFRFFIESILRVGDVTGTKMLMLPLGFSIGMIVNALLLWISFSRDYDGAKKYNLITSASQVAAASIIAGFLTNRALLFFVNPINVTKTFGLFLQGFLSGIIGIVSGIAILLLLKNKEMIELIAAIKERLWKVDVAPPDAEEL